MAALPDKQFLKKRILVVGGASGLGYSIAESLSLASAELLLADNNPIVHEIATKWNSLGRSASSVVLDVTDYRSLNIKLQELIGDKQLDGLIYIPRGRVKKNWQDVTSEDWDVDLDIALKSAFFVTKELASYFGTDRLRDKFVLFISSVLSDRVGSESVGYHMAKSGIDQLTRYLAVQMGQNGVRVNAVKVGWVVKDKDMPRFNSIENTEYRKRVLQMHALRRVGTEQDLIKAVQFLASENSSFVTGQTLTLDGGLTLEEAGSFYFRVEKNIQQL